MLRLSQILSGGYLVLVLLMAGLTLFVTPLGWAPFQLPTLGPGGAPVKVTITYSTEKEQWLKDAAQRFNATNPHIGGRAVEIDLRGQSSHEMITSIVQGKSQPSAISPASTIQIEQLRTTWAATKGSQIIGTGDQAPRSLVISPLVIVAWKDRAAPIEQATRGDFWNNIQKALTTEKGWADLGGQPTWGRLKFGHTNPETSNSGELTLLLMAYGYTGSTDLSVNQAQDSGFRTWLKGVEQGVPSLEDSTANLTNDLLIRGPSTYDFVATYENMAVEALGSPKAKENGGMRVFYPPATILSDHPYAILNAPWVTPEQRQAASMFRDFLLSREMQQLASQQYGFRPANLQVQINPSDPASPFGRYTSSGLQLDLPPQVSIPSDDVIDTLVATWKAARR